MRRVLFVAALFALLAACSLKSPEGAACDDVGGIGQCPEGQRCGHDRRCSVAATECGPSICAATTCNGKELSKCEASAAGVCASVAPSTCSEHQECDEATESCECPVGGCGLYRTCTPVIGGTSCECKPTGDCTEAGTMCSADKTATIRCQVDDECLHALAPEPCADPGTACSGTLPGASCQCPARGAGEGDGCGLDLGVASCAGETWLRCQPKAEGSLCNVWTKVEDCSLAGLQCSAAGVGACICPALPPSLRTIYVDSTAPRRVGLAVTGDQTPLCRFARVADAVGVGVATMGDTIVATGVPPVTFAEPAFTVPAGVTLTTSDAVPVPANFVIEPDETVGGLAVITLRPGAALKGVTVRNVAATGAGIATSCPDLTDTAEVSIDSVVVEGLGTGASPTRFLHGLSHGGRCSLAIRNSRIEGASDSGIHILSQSSSMTLAMTGNTVQRNKGTTAYRINGIDRLAGGIALRGTTPSAITFIGNRVLGNEGDQVVVFMAGTLNLASPGPGCSASSNVLACYTAPGVGISTAAGVVDVANTTWARPAVELLPDQDYVTAAGSTLGGITQACAAFAGNCPAVP